MGDLKRATKRLLSLFLALIMTFGLLPTAVWAEDAVPLGSSAAAPVGSSAAAPVEIAYASNSDYKRANVEVIDHEEGTHHDVTFEPFVYFTNVDSTYVYEQGRIPIGIGFYDRCKRCGR